MYPAKNPIYLGVLVLDFSYRVTVFDKIIDFYIQDKNVFLVSNIVKANYMSAH